MSASDVVLCFVGFVLLAVVPYFSGVIHRKPPVKYRCLNPVEYDRREGWLSLTVAIAVLMFGVGLLLNQGWWALLPIVVAWVFWWLGFCESRWCDIPGYWERRQIRRQSKPPSRVQRRLWGRNQSPDETEPHARPSYWGQL